MHRVATRLLLAAALAAACGLHGCGGRTSLRAPRQIPLEGTRPEVILLLDHSSSMGAYTQDGRTYWGALRDALHVVLPPLDDAVAFGSLIFPVARSGTRDLFCVTPSDLSVPARLHNATAVLNDVDASGAPSGGTPTYEALRVVESYVRAHQNDGVLRFVVLGTDGIPSCAAGGVRDVLTVLEEMAREGVQTLVIGIEPERAAPGSSFSTALDQMAVAGGRPRPEGEGAGRFYSATTPDEIASVFEETLGSLAYCRLHADLSGVRVEDHQLHARGGPMPPHDPTHVDGWDWIDQARGEIEIYGASCRRVTQDRVQLYFAVEDEIVSP